MSNEYFQEIFKSLLHNPVDYYFHFLYQQIPFNKFQLHIVIYTITKTQLIEDVYRS